MLLEVTYLNQFNIFLAGLEETQFATNMELAPTLQ